MVLLLYREGERQTQREAEDFVRWFCLEYGALLQTFSKVKIGMRHEEEKLYQENHLDLSVVK